MRVGTGPKDGRRRRIELEPLEPRTLLSAGTPNPEKVDVLTTTNVDKILADAASEAASTEVITVVGREGEILGIFARDGADLGPEEDQAGHADVLLGTVAESVARARTAADFESRGEAFTTRTARFIVQNHFPPGVDNTAGGPLYGVEFSSLPGSDVTSSDALSGDPGGVPLYIGGEPVGGIGVAGVSDGVLAVPGLPYKHGTSPIQYNGVEEYSFDEAVALAGQEGFAPPSSITANNIFVSGLRLPYVAENAISNQPRLTLQQLQRDNAGFLVLADAHTAGVNLEDNSLLHFPDRQDSGVIAEPQTKYPLDTFAGQIGTLKNTNPAANDFGMLAGADASNSKGDSANLTVNDVGKIITDAVAQALITRAGIREPLGVNAVIHVAVTDTQGNILGVFAMNDATDFSYDIAVQKARTAAFFSSNTAAITATAVGFLSEEFFPQGIEDASSGPLYELQNAISLDAPLVAPIQNGITIFPGGVPLYKNGVLVGAVGISGDGVTQDDSIAYAGSAGFRPPTSMESDNLSGAQLVTSFTDSLNKLTTDYETAVANGKMTQAEFNHIESIISTCVKRVSAGFGGVRLPYVKFPRDPLVSD